MHRRFLVVPAWEELLQERKDGGGKEGVQGRMRQLWRASFLGALRALSGLVLDLGLFGIPNRPHVSGSWAMGFGAR